MFHKALNILRSSPCYVLQVKLSLYKNNVEVAWVTFHNTINSHVDWFNSSNVINASPWDPDLLRTSTTIFNIEKSSQ